MIVCPKCSATLATHGVALWECACGAKYERVRKIWRFVTDSKSTFEDHTEESIKALAENAGHHFWLLERKRIVVSAIKQYLGEGDRFLDMGVGACDIAHDLRVLGVQLLLADIQPQSLDIGAELGFEDLFQFDIHKPIFRDHVNGVGVFDVLEHLDDDKTAVASLLQMVLPGGYIFVTVPAFQGLWNNRDVMERHKRRYSRRQLEKLFRSQGADVLSCSYTFFSIFPLLVLRALQSRFRPRDAFRLEDYRSQFKINPHINRVLKMFTQLEERWFGQKGPPFGGSLLLIAQKSSES